MTDAKPDAVMFYEGLGSLSGQALEGVREGLLVGAAADVPRRRDDARRYSSWLPPSPEAPQVARHTVDAMVMASAVSREGDVVATSEPDDMFRLQAFFPSVRIVTV